jgi:hypothetical protein
MQPQLLLCVCPAGCVSGSYSTSRLVLPALPFRLATPTDSLTLPALLREQRCNCCSHSIGGSIRVYSPADTSSFTS